MHTRKRTHARAQLARALIHAHSVCASPPPPHPSPASSRQRSRLTPRSVAPPPTTSTPFGGGGFFFPIFFSLFFPLFHTLAHALAEARGTSTALAPLLLHYTSARTHAHVDGPRRGRHRLHKHIHTHTHSHAYTYTRARYSRCVHTRNTAKTRVCAPSRRHLISRSSSPFKYKPDTLCVYAPPSRVHNTRNV